MLPLKIVFGFSLPLQSEIDFKNRLGIKNVTVEHEVIPLAYSIAFSEFISLNEFYESLVNLVIYDNNDLTYSLKSIFYDLKNFPRFDDCVLDYWENTKERTLSQVSELRDYNKDIEEWLENVQPKL